MLQVLPILAIFLSGYIFKRFRGDISDALVDFAVYFVFPVFIIYKIHFLEFDASILKVSFLGICAFTFGIVFTLIVTKIFSINKNSAAMIAISVAFGNTSFLGFAFVQTYYGEDALSLAIFYDQIATMILISIFAPIIISIAHEEQKVSFKQVIISIVTFPPTVAFVIAIISKLFVLPNIVVDFFQIISKALLPLVIFAVGMKFSLGFIHSKKRDIALTLLIKLILVPLSVYFLATMIFEIDLSVKVAVIEAAMPPMVLGTVLAVRAGLDKDLGLGSLGVGMILSFVTVPFLVWFIG